LSEDGRVSVRLIDAFAQLLLITVNSYVNSSQVKSVVLVVSLNKYTQSGVTTSGIGAAHFTSIGHI
jgi:hypothetical protein